MTLIAAWNEATWKERIIFLVAIFRKYPQTIKAVQKRVEK